MKNIFEIASYPNPHIKSTETSKKPFEVETKSLFKQQVQISFPLILSLISDTRTLSAASKQITSKLLTFLKRYDVVNPSQQFIGNMTGVERETVNRLLQELHNLGYIKKQDNGWAICDKKQNGIYRKNKLTYTMGSRIKLLLKLINTRTRYYTKEIAMAVALIPALGLFIGQNVTDTNSYSPITSVNIKKENSKSCGLTTTPLKNDFVYQLESKRDKKPTSSASVSSYLQELRYCDYDDVATIVKRKDFIKNIRKDYYGLAKYLSSFVKTSADRSTEALAKVRKTNNVATNSIGTNSIGWAVDKLSTKKKMIAKIVRQNYLNLEKYPFWMEQLFIEDEKIKKQKTIERHALEAKWKQDAEVSRSKQVPLFLTYSQKQ